MRILLFSFLLLLVVVAPAMAQDSGVPDTVAIVASVIPDATTGQNQLQLDIEVFNDELIAGNSMGFSWDHSGLTLDSAVATDIVTSQYQIGPFFYEETDINLTNANQRFLLGGAVLFSPGISPAPNRRKWASYYFTVTNWAACDSVLFDTLRFNAGSSFIFSPAVGAGFQPVYTGALVAKDTATCASPANLVVDPMVLNFTGEEGSANPSSQVLNIGSDADPLVYSLTNDSTWLTYMPSTATTPQPALVSVNTAGKPAGSYTDTITVSAVDAVNSPQKVIVNLTVTPRPNMLVVAPDTLSFTAEEGGANPPALVFNVSEMFGRSIPFTAVETATWFGLNKTAGMTPDSVAVTPILMSMAPGDYMDSIEVASTSATNGPLYVIVKMTVTPRPRVLVVTPDTLSFTAEEGGANPASQFLYVSETGGDAIAFTSVETSSWLTLDKVAGTTPDSVASSVDLTGLMPGTYTDSIVVASATASNGPQWVIVEFTVTPRPRMLVVTPDSLVFTATMGAGNPASMLFDVSEIGGDNIAFTTAKNATWLTLSTAGSTTPDTVGASVDMTGLTAGTYIDSVEFGSVAASNTPMYKRVIFNLLPAVNEPVVLDSIGPKMVNEGEQLMFLVHATDPDGTTPVLTTSTLPAGATFADSLNGTGLFVWMPTFDQAGLDPMVTFYASDGEFIDSETVAITVVNVNRPPIADAVNDTTIDECMVLNKFFYGNDPDSEMIYWSAEGLTPNMLFEDSNGIGVFIFAPDTTSAGTYPITIHVTDGTDTTSFTYTVTVEDCIIPNNPPVLDAYNDTTISDCEGGLTKTFTATDADGHMLSWQLLSTTPDSLLFTDSGYYASLYVSPSTPVGVYPIDMSVTDGIDTVLFTYTVTVTPCDTTPCVNIILADTAFSFVDTIGVGSGMYTDTLSISSSGADVEVRMGYSLIDDWVMPVYDTIMTPGILPIKINTTGLTAGIYQTVMWIEALDTMNVCEPYRTYFTVNLTVVDTTTVGGGDELVIGTVPAVPGAQIVVPVTFTNGCDLTGISALMNWDDSLITLDSISFEESRVAGFGLKTITVDNLSRRGGAAVFMDSVGMALAPGTGNFLNMYFSVAPEIPAGFYPIVPEQFSATETVYFIENCNSMVDTWVTPDIISGGITVDTASNYVCGYVVDPDGHPIPGATVELWDDFAGGMAMATTLANGSGAFSFDSSNVVPFDLWAHMDGYYPKLVENQNFGTTGIMIVLTPVSPVAPTWEWVSFYCGSNTYFGSPLPVGSVVDAYDPDGVHCGTRYVSEAGSYGFMIVYRDDPYTTEDEGADPGDAIIFFVNGSPVQATGDVTWTENGDRLQVCLEAGQVTHTCDLFVGWNLISWSVDTDSDAITDALASLDGCIDVVLGFEQGGLTYDPALPQFSTLKQVDHLSGYWVKSTCNVTLEITGAPVSASTPIAVTAGWNLVSYLPDFNMEPMVALASIHDDLVVALGFDTTGLTYQPGQDMLNSLTSMSPCNGYWVKVNNNGTLIYPGVGPDVSGYRPTVNNPIATAIPEVTPTRTWMNLYANKLTLDGEVVKAGAVITAHTSDGLKVGSFTMNADGMFGFMPIYADDKGTAKIDGVVEGENFYLSIDGVETAEAFSFTSHGDRVEIFNLAAKTETDPTLPTSFSLSQNYPNPFNPTTTISFSLPADGQATLEVFNILGRLVATPFDGIATAGENQVIWDGTNSVGESVASGIYFYRLTADNYTETRKMTLLK